MNRLSEGYKRAIDIIWCHTNFQAKKNVHFLILTMVQPQPGKVVQTEQMTDYKTFQKRRCISPQQTLSCTHSSVLLCYTASLQMGQMGPKMTLGTLTMSGDDFPGVQGALRGSNSDPISDIYWRHSDTAYCSRQGGHQRSNGCSNDKRQKIFQVDWITLKMNDRLCGKPAASEMFLGTIVLRN